MGKATVQKWMMDRAWRHGDYVTREIDSLRLAEDAADYFNLWELDPEFNDTVVPQWLDDLAVEVAERVENE